MPRVCVALLFLAVAIEPAIMESTGLKKEKAGKKITIVGCLVETEGHFTISGEDHSTEFLLMTRGDIEVRDYVGHVISVRGRTVGSDGYVSIGKDHGKPDRLIGIKVESVRMARESCEMK
jgi:hypothetical protein